MYFIFIHNSNNKREINKLSNYIKSCWSLIPERLFKEGSINDIFSFVSDAAHSKLATLSVKRIIGKVH